MKIFILIFTILLLYSYTASAQNVDFDFDLKLQIKELNNKVQAALADGRKSEAFAYMDSIAVILRKDDKSSILYMPQNIMPEEDKLSVILGYFDRQRRMILVEEKKVPNSNDETK